MTGSGIQIAGVVPLISMPRAPEAAVAPYLHYSSFDGPNGTDITAFVPEVGNAWTKHSGVSWLIDSNRIRVLSGAAAFATTSVVVSDHTIEVTFYGTLVNPNGGICIRRTDDTHAWALVAIAGTNRLHIYEFNGGATSRASIGVPITDHVAYTLKLTALGQQLDGWLDGANHISYGSAALNETNKTVGLYAYGSGVAFDNFIVTA